MTIQFRPHHFLCSFCFKGKGYSPKFLDNYLKIIEQLGDDEVPIEIVGKSDSICAPCPHNLGTSCTTEAKITALDQAHAAALDIHIGDTITWKTAKVKIKNKISLDVFHQICTGCEWKALGICESVLKADVSPRI